MRIFVVDRASLPAVPLALGLDLVVPVSLRQRCMVKGTQGIGIEEMQAVLVQYHYL